MFSVFPSVSEHFRNKIRKLLTGLVFSVTPEFRRLPEFRSLPEVEVNSLRNQPLSSVAQLVRAYDC